MTQSKVKWVRLGDYIEQKTERNDLLLLGEEYAVGVNINKEMGKMKAKIDPTKLPLFYLVKPGYFVFNQRGSRKLGIGLNQTDSTFITTYDHVVFMIKEDCKELLDSLFLFMFLSRKEFDRNAEYCSWGSSTEYFRWKNMCEVIIPLPSITRQREIVETWQGLRKMKEENEQIAEPLLQLCQSYIQDLKKKYPMVEIGPWIEESDERNSELSIKLSQGIANTKVFQDPKQVSSNSKGDKIVRHGYFGFNRATTRNGEKISIAYREGPDCTVSSAYGVFRITDENVICPHFLWMWVSRPEFDRYARYMSKGSAHEFFDMDDMKRVRIPLPPIDVQHAIVNIYNCAKEAKRIANEADQLSRDICPALMQQVINE